MGNTRQSTLEKECYDFSGTVLDVGSGAGSTIDPSSSVTIESLRPSLLVFLDRSFETAAHPGCRVRVDLEKSSLPIVSSTCDAALCNHVLEHVRDPDHLLQEIARVLRPNGVLVCSAPNGWSLSDNLFKLWRLIFVLLKGENIEHVQRFSKRKFIAHIEGAGFRILNVSDIGETYTWLARHPVLKRILTWFNRRLRFLHNETFIYGWCVTGRKGRALSLPETPSELES